MSNPGSSAYEEMEMSARHQSRKEKSEAAEERLRQKRIKEFETLSTKLEIFCFPGLTILPPEVVVKKAMELECTPEEIVQLSKELQERDLANDDDGKIQRARVFDAEQRLKKRDKIQEEEIKSKAFDYKKIKSEDLIHEMNRQDNLARLKKDPLLHITPALDHYFKLVISELYLIGALTNHGKTSLICFWAARLVGKGVTAVIFSNETSAVEYYRRIACLALGLDYTSSAAFTDVENIKIRKTVESLNENRLLYVIDSDVRTELGQINTHDLNGLETLVERLETEERQFVLFVDYLQKITSHHLGRTEALQNVIDFLDRKRKGLNGSIIAFSQLKPKSREASTFGERTKWNKSLIDSADFALELTRDYKNYIVKLVLQKQRNSDLLVGAEFPLLIHSGRFLDPTPENIRNLNYRVLSDDSGGIVIEKIRDSEKKNEAGTKKRDDDD